MPGWMAPRFAHAREPLAGEIIEDNSLPVTGVLRHEIVATVTGGHLEEHALVIGTDRWKSDRRRFAEFFRQPVAKHLLDLADFHRRADLARVDVIKFQVTVLARVPVASIKWQ